eukprot:jgi/Astpho2/6414/fgenesh1_pg.00093_%23_6_t
MGRIGTGLLAAAAVIAVLNKILGLREERLVKRPLVIGVIPARYNSSRFPGKPLAKIRGVPMIIRTWQQACKAAVLDRVIVATDDERIASLCREAGAEVVLTDAECANGTARCREAVSKLSEHYNVVVNIQGDEPLIEPQAICDVVSALRQAPDAVYSTACTPLRREDASSTSRVKVITDLNGYALYFSRGVLPGNKSGEPQPFPIPFQDHQYLLHLGLQCYDSSFLKTYCHLPATPLMVMEDLEQLKVLEHGYKMKTVVVHNAFHGVDKPGDIETLEHLMRQQGIH